jgi:hypothetical protein
MPCTISNKAVSLRLRQSGSTADHFPSCSPRSYMNIAVISAPIWHLRSDVDLSKGQTLPQTVLFECSRISALLGLLSGQY